MSAIESKTPETLKQEFIETYTKYIHRDGSDKLLAWLQSKDFFTAPASSRYHSCYEGGLCAHSLNVFKRLVEDYEIEAIKNGTDTLSDKTMESLAIVALLHDLCKCDFYEKTCRAKKVYKEGAKKFDSLGSFEWEDSISFNIEEKLFFGHGEKSVYIIMNFMRLTPAEAMAIRYHMGDFTNEKATSSCYNAVPIATMLHIADLKATYLDERDTSIPVYSFKVKG